MSEERKSVAIVIAGSGGTGAITAGSALLAAAARDGHYGLMTKLSGAQVRGGEAAALFEIGVEPIEAQPDRYDCLIALDWQDVHRFAPEIPLDGDSIIVCDPKNGAVPEAATMKPTDIPGLTCWFAGCDVIRGGSLTLRMAGLERSLPAAFVTRQS